VDRDADIAAVAALIGQEARASMLSALADGRAASAGELADRARVSPATASAHLARLRSAGLVTVERKGRRREVRLAGDDVAAAVEALAVIAPPRSPTSLREARAADGLRDARTCYDHLAGRLGVELAERMCDRGLLTEDAFALTDRGEQWCAELGIDIPGLRGRRRPLTRACLDWTERRPHLAGALGAALTELFLARGWIDRRAGSRAVRVTPHGRAGLEAVLGAVEAAEWVPPRRARARTAYPTA
jgi:DNA-binding transcriptional ArsR family regulator